MQAIPGTTATALTWPAPSSDGGAPITSYLVTVYGMNAPGPITVSCAGNAPCTSVEIAGLSNDYTYILYVQADNGTLGPAGYVNTVIPAATGSSAVYDVFSHALTHTASVGVNVANGDLVATSTDLSITGVGLPLTIGRTYNSLAGTTGAFGRDSSSSIGPDVSLSIASGGGVLYHGPDGATDAFAPSGSTFVGPPDFSATLAQASGNYTLTLEPSGTAYHFTSTGQLSSEADRNGNAIDFAYNPDATLSRTRVSAGEDDESPPKR
ncbi:MAG: DUF6531 domain-containing protein [Acidimicrobiales bacterium]